MINKKLIKAFYFTILLLISLSAAYALTLDGLISSYNYNFNDGTINITLKTDKMTDTDGDGMNDTVMLNLTSNAASGTYSTYVSLDDPNGKIVKRVTKTLSASDTNFNINFSTSLLSQNKYNYTIGIENVNGLLVYEEHNVETGTYTAYEKGTNIISMTDENVNNADIQINVTLNVTVNETANITVALRYNNSHISSTEEKTVTEGMKTIQIRFDNETIKNTHHAGKYNIDFITFGKRVFETDQNTSSYDYETFAKTSYIKDYSDGKVDLNGNNLSEYLEINFTVSINSSGNYTLEAELYDTFDSFIALINETRSLSTGNQIINAQVNGTSIYSAKIDGPYVISSAKLYSNGILHDATYNMYVTNVSYFTDFERPSLPDLEITMNISFLNATNNTNITINVTNIGDATAFNVFVDIFNNRSYENQSFVAFLDVNKTETFYFLANNTTNTTIFTAMAYNSIDESDRSNNIIQQPQSTVSESDARIAIETGVNNSVLTNFTLYTDFRLVTRYINNTQLSGLFDKVVIKGNQTWAFNYVTENEFFTNLSGLNNYSLVVLENQSLTTEEITNQVKTFVNNTKW